MSKAYGRKNTAVAHKTEPTGQPGLRSRKESNSECGCPTTSGCAHAGASADQVSLLDHHHRIVTVSTQTLLVILQGRLIGWHVASAIGMEKCRQGERQEPTVDHSSMGSSLFFRCLTCSVGMRGNMLLESGTRTCCLELPLTACGGDPLETNRYPKFNIRHLPTPKTSLKHTAAWASAPTASTKGLDWSSQL